MWQVRPWRLSHGASPVASTRQAKQSPHLSSHISLFFITEKSQKFWVFNNLGSSWVYHRPPPSDWSHPRNDDCYDILLCGTLDHEHCPMVYHHSPHHRKLGCVYAVTIAAMSHSAYPIQLCLTSRNDMDWYDIVGILCATSDHEHCPMVYHHSPHPSNHNLRPETLISYSGPPSGVKIRVRDALLASFI